MKTKIILTASIRVLIPQKKLWGIFPRNLKKVVSATFEKTIDDLVQQGSEKHVCVWGPIPTRFVLAPFVIVSDGSGGNIQQIELKTSRHQSPLFSDRQGVEGAELDLKTVSKNLAIEGFEMKGEISSRDATLKEEIEW